MTYRTLERIVHGQATSDGDGVKLTRVLTQDLQQRLDPFLMLDAFRNNSPDDYMGGFPDHPHRGFETVTYMLRCADGSRITQRFHLYLPRRSQRG